MNALTMRTVSAVLCVFPAVVGLRAQENDPCRNKETAIETRECYTRERTRVNAEADKLANSLAADLRKQASDPVLGAPDRDLLRKGADAVLQSQGTWRSYRDQHCKAVAFTWTTGSGAGTALESCMLQLANARIKELNSGFNRPAAK
jgi:uncharacterized protein YecT (DUF1311 family)